MAGPSYYCWSCYAHVPVAAGRCAHCGGTIETPSTADYVDRLIWALDHPLVERRMIAARVLGRRRERRASGRLCQLARSADDPYLAATAVTALVRITGRPESADLLEELADLGPAPLRRTARKLLEP